MSLTYKDAGVDKEAGYRQVALIKDIIKRTHTPGVLSDLGGFSGLFQINKEDYREPVLVSGTDGVGTKLMIAFLMDKHNSIGEDCVAMCANDILCQGAKPLFFLDYIATGKLIPEKMAEIVEGVAKGCIKAGAALIGGETAEMPGLYKEAEYDMAGFCVGIVDKDRVINGENISEGDIIIGLPSSGLHSNGFSLVRKIVFEKMNFHVDTFVDDLNRTIGEELLEATRIYREPLLSLIENFKINGISHITGGGLYENIPRILPKNCQANIDTSKIEKQIIFDLLEEWGNISREEMYSTFNMGVGMVLIVPKGQVAGIEEFLKKKGERYYLLGEITKGNREVILW